MFGRKKKEKEFKDSQWKTVYQHMNDGKDIDIVPGYGFMVKPKMPGPSPDPFKKDREKQVKTPKPQPKIKSATEAIAEYAAKES